MRPEDPPLFSICIPQFNRTSFLLRSLGSLRQQTSKDFEICISDGGSSDGREQEIRDFLRNSDCRGSYVRQRSPAPYDRNLRAAVAMAQGHYCFLLGNDDMLNSEETLAQLSLVLRANDFPEVVITNYNELSTGRDFRRISKTGVIGSGVVVAAANFRNYSFVSGVLLERKSAQEHATEKWDGSEMYQTFLATRIVASGGRLLGIAETAVFKDIQIQGAQVDSYARRPRVEDKRIVARSLPLSKLGILVMDALAPYLDNSVSNSAARRIFHQLLIYTYPPWLIEYRRIQSWTYAVGIALGMRPRRITKGLRINWFTKSYIAALYSLVTVGGLIFPIRLFEYLKPWLHSFAKRR